MSSHHRLGSRGFRDRGRLDLEVLSIVAVLAGKQGWIHATNRAWEWRTVPLIGRGYSRRSRGGMGRDSRTECREPSRVRLPSRAGRLPG